MTGHDSVEPEDPDGVVVWVSGDGGDWSLSPSIKYVLPTDLFDQAMQVYALNTQQDLQELQQRARREIEAGTRRGPPGESSSGSSHGGGAASGAEPSGSQWTTVYASAGGSWAGLPPQRFVLPSDVFAYLTEGGAQGSVGSSSTRRRAAKAIGWLDSEGSLAALVQVCRARINFGMPVEGRIYRNDKP